MNNKINLSLTALMVKTYMGISLAWAKADGLYKQTRKNLESNTAKKSIPVAKLHLHNA
jgi:hypothetical protein